MKASAPRSRPIGMSALAIRKSCRFWRVEHVDGPPLCIGSEGRSQPEKLETRLMRAGDQTSTDECARQRTRAGDGDRTRMTSLEG